MATVAELLDQGVKAYTRGESAEAERFWKEALELEPGNERVRAYLRQVRGELPPRPAAPSSPDPEPPVRPEPAFAPSPWDAGPATQATVVVDDGDGLDLDVVGEKSDIRSLVPDPKSGARPPALGDVATWMEGARELFALGDFTGSLEMIERILRIDPTHAEARAYLRQNESTLVAMYESKLGSLSSVPRLAIHAEEVMWLNLDHRAGFLLAQVDGTISYDDLFALSGLPRLDTARILASLLSEGVIR
jgi:tetratricopeptide (TPR) repeat protein